MPKDLPMSEPEVEEIKNETPADVLARANAILFNKYKGILTDIPRESDYWDLMNRYRGMINGNN